MGCKETGPTSEANAGTQHPLDNSRPALHHLPTTTWYQGYSTLVEGENFRTSYCSSRFVDNRREQHFKYKSDLTDSKCKCRGAQCAASRTGVRVANVVKSVASVYVKLLSVIILLIAGTAGLVECAVSVLLALRGALRISSVPGSGALVAWSTDRHQCDSSWMRYTHLVTVLDTAA